MSLNKIFTFILLITIAISCSVNQRNKKQKEVNNNKANYPNFTNAYDLNIDSSKKANNVLIDKLQGVWAENKTENAFFMIKRDTITYVENLANPFKYIIVKDTLMYKYPEGVFKINILKATGDSLVINSDGTIMRFYNRRKNW